MPNNPLDYAIVRRVIRDEGNYPLPVQNGEVSIGNLHTPIEMLVVSWSIKQEGDSPPTIPSPKPLESGLTFIDADIAPSVPMPQPDKGIQLWQISGTYRYAINRAKGFDDGLATGRMPWAPQTAAANTIPAAMFSQDLVNTGGGDGAEQLKPDKFPVAPPGT